MKLGIILPFGLLCMGLAMGAVQPQPDDPRREVDAFLAESDLSKCRQQIARWRLLPGKEQLSVLNSLASRLSDVTKNPVVNLKDLAVGPRIRAGELPDPGFGQRTEQDVFIIGGKAGWAIESLLDVPLPVGISEKMTDRQQELAISMLKAAVASFERGLRAATIPATRASTTQP